MIDTATAWIQAQLTFNTYTAILLYWTPMSICVAGYTWRTWANYQKDLKKREEYLQSPTNAGYYQPTDTIGSLIGRAIVTLCPIANLWAACFDVGPKMFGKFFQALYDIFDQPLVPRKERK